MAEAAETGAPPHGGRLLDARRRFPDAPEPFIDLSTGINPRPYPLPPMAIEAWTRLPEPEAMDALGKAAALAYGVHDASVVVCAPGTQILISLLPHILHRREASIFGRTYGEYAHAWRQAGGTARVVGRLEELEGAGTAVVCNPNNPDGRRIEPDVLLALADRLAARGGLLLVDEAFADFDQELSLAPFLPHPGVMVLRSFGKAYGLAGLRLGFALAEPATARRLRAALGPWAVSGPACVIAAQALADRAWRDRTETWLKESAVRLDAVLRSAGLSTRGGTALFRLAESPRAAAIARQLGQAGILLRQFDDEPTWLRFGLPGDQSAAERLRTALHA